MTDLARWLLARIAEREKVAHAAAARVRRWPKTTRPPWVQARSFAEGERFAALEAFEGRETPEEVLAWCAALRQIVTLHDRPHECSTYEPLDGSINEATWVSDGHSCSTVRLLALPLAHQPGYDPAWAVES